MTDEPQSSPARRRPSITDVAVTAGVSRGAVSKVLRNAYGVSPDMRARVESAIERLGYRPRVAARAMRGASFTIGFEFPHLGNPFFTQVVDGATARLAGSGYRLIIAPGLGPFLGTSVLEDLVDRQVDGVIGIQSDVGLSWLERLAQEVPFVLLGRHDDSQAFDSVTGDDFAGTNAVMDHLFELGHRSILHFSIAPPTPQAPHAVRQDVYVSRMRQAGLEPQVVYCGPLEREAEQQARSVLELDPPTAIFAGHDELAMGVLRAVAKLRLDVSVVGYDDIPVAGHPLISLTTVDQFGVKMGAKAVDLLLERISQGRRTPTHYEFEPELRVRGSSRPVLSPARKRTG